MLKFYKRIQVDGRWMLEHRYIASKIIGRDLLESEVVHHIDENKMNNNTDNLMVFVSNSAHASYHGGGELIHLGGNLYDCIKKENIREKICSCCGGLSYGNMCNSCYKYNKGEHISSKKILLSLYKKHGSFVGIGKEIGISDNAVRKWFIKRGLPIKKKELNAMLVE